MTHEPLVIILLGPPGVGKGTQAAALSQKLKVPHISTGEIFRDNIKKHTPLGQEVQKTIESGKLVSDSLVNALVFDRVQAKDCNNGYILDGYPRTEEQAVAFEVFLNHRFPLKVINYFVEDKIILQRLTGRLICSHCGQPFHQLFHPPKKQGICDLCSHPLLQRKDDEHSTVLDRLRTYKKQTQPLIQFYAKKALLNTVRCDGSIEEVLKSTLSLLKQEQKKH